MKNEELEFSSCMCPTGGSKAEDVLENECESCVFEVYKMKKGLVWVNTDLFSSRKQFRGSHFISLRRLD